MPVLHNNQIQMTVAERSGFAELAARILSIALVLWPDESLAS
jgi:hypothetical protein